MQPELKALLERRCKRSIAVILGVAEREVGSALSPEQHQKLRKVVLDVFHDYQGLIEDVMESLDTGEVALNALYLEKIDQIHATLVDTPSRPAPMSSGSGSNGHRSPSEFGGGRPRSPA